MKTKKYTKIAMSVFLVLMALWVATPKVYIHNLLNHHHGIATPGTETNVGAASTDDCDFEKYDKPVYFNIFKFIFSFIPSKAQEEDKVSDNSGKSAAISFAVSLLRAPPLSN